MIKIEVIDQEENVRVLYVESSAATEQELEALDKIYEALLTERPKTGGYTSSKRFKVEVLLKD